jgi:hypothetical protein
MTAAQNPLLAGSLYAFTLPRELLGSLQLRATDTGATSTEQQHGLPSSHNLGTTDVSSSLGCAACGVGSFPTVAEQREHFRSDWHRYNVKVRLGGDAKAVGEEEFAAMVDCKRIALFPIDPMCLLGYSQGPSSVLLALSASISGSGSSSSDASSSSSTNAVSRLLRKHDISKAPSEDNLPAAAGPRSPLLWFSADAAVPDTQLGIYRAIFPSNSGQRRLERPADGWQTELTELQVTPEVPKTKKFAATLSGPIQDPTDFESRSWTMLMVGGGHFAAMVVSLVPKIVNKGGGRMEREEVVLEKKTFHRYTSTSNLSIVGKATRVSDAFFFRALSSSEARWRSVSDGQC